MDTINVRDFRLLLIHEKYKTIRYASMVCVHNPPYKLISQPLGQNPPSKPSGVS